MKNAIAGLVLAASVLLPGFAMAQSTDCQATPTPASCQGNGDPMNLTMPWGLTGYQSTLIKPGASVTDEGGWTLSCPVEFRSGCFDITHTAYYRTQMLSIGQQLKALGYTGGPFGGWIKLAQ